MKCLKEYPCNLAERHFIQMVIFESNGCILTPALEDARRKVRGKTPIDKDVNQDFEEHNATG